MALPLAFALGFLYLAFYFLRGKAAITDPNEDALDASRSLRGLARFIDQHAIEILDFKAWTAKKGELGEAVYR